MTILDGMTGLYNGGPSFHPEYTWPHNGLIVVAGSRGARSHGAQIIERKRAEKGSRHWLRSGRPATYIATAADAQHKLGTDVPGDISLIEA